MKRIARYLIWPGALIGLAALSLGINITFVVIAHINAPEVVTTPARPIVKAEAERP